MKKTTLHRLERGEDAISQYPIEREQRILPHVPEPKHAGERLQRFLDAYGVTPQQADLLLELPRRTHKPLLVRLTQSATETSSSTIGQTTTAV